jgi:hypothetical protein
LQVVVARREPENLTFRAEPQLLKALLEQKELSERAELLRFAAALDVARPVLEALTQRKEGGAVWERDKIRRNPYNKDKKVTFWVGDKQTKIKELVDLAKVFIDEKYVSLHRCNPPEAYDEHRMHSEVPGICNLNNGVETD